MRKLKLFFAGIALCFLAASIFGILPWQHAAAGIFLAAAAGFLVEAKISYDKGNIGWMWWDIAIAVLDLVAAVVNFL